MALTPAQQQAAVRKLTAGQSLSAAERAFLGLSTATPSKSTPKPTPVVPTQVNSPEEDAYYTAIVGNTGKTQAQLDALENAKKTASQINELYGAIGITSTVDPGTGRVVTTNNIAGKKAADAAAKAAEEKAAAEAAIVAARTAAELQAAKDALAAANAAAAKAAQAAADARAASQAAANAADANTNINVTGNTVIPAAGTTAADIAAKLAADQALEQKMQERIATSKILADRFQKYNLSSLAPKIKELAINGANEATIMLELQETEEYKRRFRANEERIKKNLAVLTPAEYLNVEDGYRQVLRAYGLNQFDTDDYVSQFIANDVSPNEFSNRVVTAVQRIQNADPAITKQLRDYYGIGQNDLVAYVLDPQQQFQKIERQVAASEIGVAAARQGLTAGVSVAEQLAAQGVTQAEAQKGYATIADILPTAEKLSDIYGSTMDTYGQSEAEQEVFNSLASAQRKRQRLTAREIASFSGAAGVNRTSLTTPTVGQYQNPERTYRPRQRNRPIVGASQFPRTELWPANYNEQKGGLL